MLHACANGSSELLTNVAMPLVTMLYNAELMRLAGADGVAAWGVVMYVSFVFVAVFLGYAMAVTPVVGYQFGAGDRAELRGVLLRSLSLLGGTGAAMCGAAVALAGPLGRFFVGYDAALLALTRHAFRVYALSFVAAGWNIFASAFFTGLGDGLRSGFVALLRTLVFAAAAVLALPAAFGIEGVWWATPATEAATLLVVAALLLAARRRYGYERL